jgi:ACS family hexuronate transporter-like MFS transporter
VILSSRKLRSALPRKAVAFVVGIGGAVGAVGGMLMAQYAGWTLQTLGNYTPILAACALVYAVAVGLIHVITPRYQIVGSV